MLKYLREELMSQTYGVTKLYQDFTTLNNTLNTIYSFNINHDSLLVFTNFLKKYSKQNISRSDFFILKERIRDEIDEILAKYLV